MSAFEAPITRKRSALVTLLDDAHALRQDVETALHDSSDLAAAKEALDALNAALGNARAIHTTNPIKPTETEKRDSAAELEDLSSKAAEAQDALDSALAQAAALQTQPTTSSFTTTSTTTPRASNPPSLSPSAAHRRTSFDDPLNADLLQERQALQQQIEELQREKAAAALLDQQLKAERATFDERMARMEAVVARLQSSTPAFQSYDAQHAGLFNNPSRDTSFSSSAPHTLGSMQLAGAIPRANVAATALTKEFECALANGGHSPSMVAGANNGGRSWTKAQFASIIATGTQIKQKAAWSSASFSICQSSSRPVRIQFSKTTLMMAYNFQFGHEGDNAGIGLEHVIPLRAGQSNLILSPAEIDSLDTYRVATLTTDDQLRLSEVPTNASGPLPTLPILNGADLLARINGLTRFLSHLYDQSADPQRFTSNLLESVPACTLTQGLTTVAQAIEVIIAEKGELSPGPGLDALRIAINKAMAEFTASLRVLASEASLLLGSPSISDRMRLREQLASYLQSAFNPLIERLFGVYDLSFRNLLLAPSSLPSVKPSIAPTGQPSTRDILRAVPAHPRHPCVSGMIYNECTRSDCRYEHDGSKLSASSLTTLLHNLGSLLKGRSVPSEGQGGSRA
jgi:hypothetical protein